MVDIVETAMDPCGAISNNPVSLTLMYGCCPFEYFENQAVPMGLHNLMKTFKPNIATLILTALTILKLIILLYLIRCVY